MNGIDFQLNECIDVFCRRQVIKAQCIFGTELIAETDIITDYSNQKNFKHMESSYLVYLLKHIFYQAFISLLDFRRNVYFNTFIPEIIC